MIDPSTGQPVSYTVDIPEKLKGIFVFEETDLLIYSKINTKDIGFTGFYKINVATICN